MITIIDYNLGNLFSVQNLLNRSKIAYKISKNPKEIENADALLLPGVGSFNIAMQNLKKLNLDLAIKKAAKKQTPILGICLGMQLLFESSSEGGFSKGLNLIPGEVIEFDDQTSKIPHMGWNSLIKNIDDFLFDSVDMNLDYYFVHSYYVKTDSKYILSNTKYEHNIFPSIVKKNNIIGMQFHPEKSDIAGFKLIENFKEYIK